MTPSSRLRPPPAYVSIAAVAGTAVLAVLIALVSAHPSATGLDRDAFSAARDLRGGTGLAIAKVVTALGGTVVFAAVSLVAALALLWRGLVAEAGIVAIGAAAGSAIVQLIKSAVDRPRPPHALTATSGASFPSGHAAHSIVYLAIALVLARAARQGGPAPGLVAGAGLLALLIGVSRVYLRAHYLTDVIAGWSAGVAALALTAIALLLIGRLRHNATAP